MTLHTHTNMHNVTGTVTAVKRTGRYTVYGNPIMYVELNVTHIDGMPNDGFTYYEFRISDNAGIVYGIENPTFRNNLHTFELTRAGRISGEYTIGA